MSLILRALLIEHVSDADASVRWQGPWIEVVEPGSAPSAARWRDCKDEFRMMCSAIMSDIQSADGSGATTLAAIQRVESSLSNTEELGGNAWYTFIFLEGVHFEGQYEQGDGGRVSLAQYKLAVETYIRFLRDPDQRPIEVTFPCEGEG